jgi:hypothetical protein
MNTCSRYRKIEGPTPSTLASMIADWGECCYIVGVFLAAISLVMGIVCAAISADDIVLRFFAFFVIGGIPACAAYATGCIMRGALKRTTIYFSYVIPWTVRAIVTWILVGYASLRRQLGAVLSAWISDTPYLFERVSSLVVRIIVVCMRASTGAMRSTAIVGDHALRAVTVISTRSCRVLQARGRHVIASVLRCSYVLPLHVENALLMVGASHFYRECRLRGRAAWIDFLFVITSPIRLFARTLLLIIPPDPALDDVRITRYEERFFRP